MISWELCCASFLLNAASNLTGFSLLFTFTLNHVCESLFHSCVFTETSSHSDMLWISTLGSVEEWDEPHELHSDCTSKPSAEINMGASACVFSPPCPWFLFCWMTAGQTASVLNLLRHWVRASVSLSDSRDMSTQVAKTLIRGHA